MKFNVKVVTVAGKQSLYEFNTRDLAFTFAASLFDDDNGNLSDPVRYVALAPAQ